MAENSLFLSFVENKNNLKCLNLLIKRLDGSVSENMWGDFLPENAIPSSTLSILTLI